MISIVYLVLATVSIIILIFTKGEALIVLTKAFAWINIITGLVIAIPALGKEKYGDIVFGGMLMLTAASPLFTNPAISLTIELLGGIFLVNKQIRELFNEMLRL